MLVRLTALFALLAAAAVIAGCGGGGSSSVETSSGYPGGESVEGAKNAFIVEADALCSDYQAKVAPIKAELEELETAPNPESPQNEKKLGELLADAVAEAESELESLRELEPPQGDSSTIEKMLDTAQEGNGLGLEAAEALEEGETSRFGEMAKEVEALNNRAKGMAESYGLKVCAQAQ